MNKLTHFDKNGNAVMVDVSQKNETERIATACSSISLSKETLECIKNNQIGKGDVLGVARVAGIMAAKKTSDLIPMCHPLMLTSCNIDYEIDEINSNIKINYIIINSFYITIFTKNYINIFYILTKFCFSVILNILFCQFCGRER